MYLSLTKCKPGVNTITLTYIIMTLVQRFQNFYIQESVNRIIGRYGKNIFHFEQYVSRNRSGNDND